MRCAIGGDHLVSKYCACPIVFICRQQVVIVAFVESRLKSRATLILPLAKFLGIRVEKELEGEYAKLGIPDQDPDQAEAEDLIEAWNRLVKWCVRVTYLTL